MNVLSIIIPLLSLTILATIVKNKKTPTHLGVNDGLLTRLPKTPNAISSQTLETHKRVDPLPFYEDLEKSKNYLKIILANFEGINIISESKNYIHAVTTSATMRFHDDIEFFFDERSKLIHFRSASRVGYSDMNVNRKRYELLRDEYMKKF